MKTFDLYTTEDFSMWVQIDEWFQVRVHLDVTAWSTKVAKEIKSIWKEAKEALRLEGFSTLYTLTPNPKFVKMMGGGEVRDLLSFNGKEHTLVVWDIGGTDG